MLAVSCSTKQCQQIIYTFIRTCGIWIWNLYRKKYKQSDKWKLGFKLGHCALVWKQKEPMNASEYNYLICQRLTLGFYRNILQKKNNWIEVKLGCLCVCYVYIGFVVVNRLYQLRSFSSSLAIYRTSLAVWGKPE